MKEIVIIIALGVFTVFGYFLMKKIDNFILNNKENTSKNKRVEIKEMAINSYLSNEELLLEINKIRKNNSNIKILFYMECDD